MIGTKTIFLAQWDHKNGQDISAHKTEKGAFDQCVVWMRECLSEWCEPEDQEHYSQMSDDELFASWTDITGEEYMTVESITLHN